MFQDRVKRGLRAPFFLEILVKRKAMQTLRAVRIPGFFQAGWMTHLALVVVLQIAFVPASMAQALLSLEVDGRQYGIFASLSQSQASQGIVTLEDGWVSASFLALWQPGFATDESLPEGRYDFDGACAGRRLELIQTLATGQRGRERSWTLMDACPLWFEVESQDGEKIMVSRLVLRVQGVAAAL